MNSIKFLLSICVAIWLQNISAQSVGIGTTTPDSSAILDLASTTQGFLMPRMTTAQRDAIVNPEVGLSIFNLQDKCTDTYNVNGWDKNCGQHDKGNYAIPANTWRPRADFGGTARYSAVAFSIGIKGYIGTGYDGSYKKDFWEYDPNTDVWTQKADFGGTARNGAVGFSIGTKGYIGIGRDINSNYKKDFWEYNPSSNEWTQKADFGGTGRVSGVGFSIGTKGYIGTGTDLFAFKKDFWEYDPNTNTWIQKADFGGIARTSAIGFSIYSRGYIGTGTSGTFKKDFWEYNPGSTGSIGTWTQKADFGGTEREGTIGFSIGTKGYIGTGTGATGYKKDFWEYDSTIDNWTQKADFGGTGRVSAVGFSIGTKGYIGMGWDGSGKNDFWEYTTEPITGKEFKETIPTETTKYTGHTWTLEHNKLYPSREDANVLIKYNANLEFGSGLGKEQHAGKIGYNTFSGDGLDIVGAGTTGLNRKVRIYDRLYLQNILANRKIVLWQGADNEHQFYGFGINDGTLRYQSEGIHRFYTGTSATTSNLTLTIYADGYLGITGGACKPGGGTWDACSDYRVKKDISPYQSGLKEILKINPVHFKYNGLGETQNNGKTYVGIIAQDMEKILPSTISIVKNKDFDDQRIFDGSELTFTLINAVKELKKENDELKVKSEKLEKDNILLKADMSSIIIDLEKRLSSLEAKKL